MQYLSRFRDAVVSFDMSVQGGLGLMSLGFCDPLQSIGLLGIWKFDVIHGWKRTRWVNETHKASKPEVNKEDSERFSSEIAACLRCLKRYKHQVRPGKCVYGRGAPGVATRFP